METMNLETKKKARNSILEILRLCASLWVMYYHGMSLITRTEMFRNGRIAVDFFFLLSGFFFLSSLKKEDENNIFKGTLKFVWRKFKPLMWTFLICLVFSIIYYFQFYEGFFNTSIWGYLWYIPHLLVVFAFYYVLNKLITKKWISNLITAILVVVCFGLTLSGVTDYGIWRGVAGVGLGILLSQAPNIWKYKTGKVLSCVLVPILFIAITTIAILHPDTILQDCLCILLLFPAIVYFSSQIPLSNKVINAVCSISFGLYTYQTLARLLEANLVITSGSILFLMVFGLAVLDRLCLATIKKIKYKKAKQIES